MNITVEIPEELAYQLARAGQDPTRAALEASALEGFLKEHGAFSPYTEQDLEHDGEVARQTAQRTQRERRAG
jgi:hypothetical protein